MVYISDMYVDEPRLHIIKLDKDLPVKPILRKQLKEIQINLSYYATMKFQGFGEHIINHSKSECKMEHPVQISIAIDITSLKNEADD